MKAVFIGINLLLYFFCTGLTYGHTVEPPHRDHSISFIENKGQWIAEAKYKAEVPGGVVFLTDGGFVYNFSSTEDLDRIHKLTCGEVAKGISEADISKEVVRQHAYKVHFVGGNTHLQYQAEGKRSYYHNYFLGRDSTNWAGQVPLFETVIQQDVYTGIDVAVYSKGNSIKYDFRVAPGADPNQIRLSFQGVVPELTSDGRLRITTSVNEVIEDAPYSYQTIEGKVVTINSRYKLESGVVTIELLEDYDPDYPLTIDPTLIFSTYSGSTGTDKLSATTTYDKLGNLYAGATTRGPGWPTTLGAYQSSFSGGVTSIGINKYNALGSDLLYSTYYGGTGNENVYAMVVTEGEELVIAGATESRDLPVVSDNFDTSMNEGRDIFIAKFNKMGTQLLAGTYYGGFFDEGTVLYSLDLGIISPLEVALDKEENIWITSVSSSSDLPVTGNALQPTKNGQEDGVVFAMNPDCTELLYGTYIGGSGIDIGLNLLVNDAGDIVVCGGTTSSDFPVHNGAMHQSAPGGDADGFLSVIDHQSGVLKYSTYMGTSAEDLAIRLQVDEEDNVYVLGRTLGDYPISNNVYNNPDGDIFIDKIAADLSQSLLSTRTGNPQSTGTRYAPSAFLYDSCGNVYVSGFNSTTGLPTTPDAYDTVAKSFWFCVFEPNFMNLLYATYFGSGGSDHTHAGIHRFDPQGIVYQTICSSSGTFPGTSAGAFPTKQNVGVDNLSFKFNFEPTGIQSAFDLMDGQRDSGCAPYTVNVENTSTSAMEYLWDFGDGTTSNSENPGGHTYSDTGVFKLMLIAYNDNLCIPVDTSFKMITVLAFPPPDIQVQDTILCNALDSILLSVSVDNPGLNFFHWETPVPGSILGFDNQAQVAVNPGMNQEYYVTVWDSIPGLCSVASSDTVRIDYVPRSLAVLSPDTTVCKGSVIEVEAVSTPDYSYRWFPSDGISDSTSLTPTIEAEESTLYTLTASYPGCPDTSILFRVDVQELPDLTVIPEQEACQGDTVTMETSVMPYRNDYHYAWTPDAGLSHPEGANTYFIADSTITYVLEVATPIGCSSTEKVTVTVHPGDFADAIPDTGYCPPDAIPLWASGGDRYHWTPAYGLNDTTLADPLASPRTATYYRVYVTNEYGCRDTAQVFVDVYPNAVVHMPDTVRIYPGEKYHLESGTNAHYFDWFPPSGISATDISNPDFYPEVRTRYFVRARTEHGCEIVDSIDILVEGTVLDMPNAFVPGSAVNGTFKVAKRGIAELNSFRVFNRWGQKVFETTDIEQGWDGTFNETPQPMGVYVYQVDVVTESGKGRQLQGNVTLIR